MANRPQDYAIILRSMLVTYLWGFTPGLTHPRLHGFGVACQEGAGVMCHVEEYWSHGSMVGGWVVLGKVIR